MLLLLPLVVGGVDVDELEAEGSSGGSSGAAVSGDDLGVEEVVVFVVDGHEDDAAGNVDPGG